jgi:hypothetical protein
VAKLVHVITAWVREPDVFREFSELSRTWSANNLLSWVDRTTQRSLVCALWLLHPLEYAATLLNFHFRRVVHIWPLCRLVWPLTQRDEHRQRVSGNEVLKVFVPKRQEVTRGWRRLYYDGLASFYASTNITKMIKTRRMRWAEFVVRIVN